MLQRGTPWGTPQTDTPLVLVTYQEPLQLLSGWLLSCYLVAGPSISPASSRGLT